MQKPLAGWPAHAARFVGLATFSLMLAGATAAPIDGVTVAAMRLAEVPNYRWSASVDDGVRNYVREGRHIRAGYTWVRLPMLDAIARRLGRHAGTELEAIFRGENECVIQLGRHWKTVQLPRARSRTLRFAQRSGPRSHRQRMRGAHPATHRRSRAAPLSRWRRPD
jgi:hypothetical protein